MVTLYNVISQDGYIARADGSEDFIPDDLWEDFLILCKQYDAVVMGRKTYESIIRGYPLDLREEFEKLTIKKIVVTRDANYAVLPAYTVARSPQEACMMGENILFSSGPLLNMAVLQTGLVDQIILSILPESIGGGIKAFNIEPATTLVSKEKKSGYVRCVYRVNNES